MPLPSSPHLLPPVEISGDTQPQEDERVIPSTELPTRPQASTPFTSPQSYEETMSVIANRALALPDNNYTQQAPMVFGPEAMQWSAQGCNSHNSFIQDASCAPKFFAPGSVRTKNPQQAYNGMAYNAHYAIRYPVDYAPSRPRSFQNTDFAGRPGDMTASFAPAAYFHSPPPFQSTPSLPDTSTPELAQLNDDWDIHYGLNIKNEDQHDYTSPYSDMSRASTPYSLGHEDDPIDKEQPYAQLIYRALLDAPNHTMVLRDIYDWFRTYTDKATHSETKGWQNSIRHNLSMNGAFEKVDSPSDSTTKGFMWRLTPAALREGVKSTTRYRSKAPNKRSHRTQPLPQRQASGAKGGHAARRAASLRRSQRAREAGMYHRSTPSSDPYSNHGGYGSEWEDGTTYTASPAYQGRVDTPFTQPSFPFDTPQNDTSFPPMPGMASHLVSPPHSYNSTPAPPATPLNHAFIGGDAAYVLEQAPGESLFGGSPSPSADEPITPVDGANVWEQDIAMGIDVYEDLFPSGSGGAV